MKIMGPLRLLAVFATVTTLTACTSNRSGAEEEVRRNLKDPESAKFGDFYFNPTTKKACLVVNAKNAMGGYTGDGVILLNKTDDGWQYVSDNDTDFDTCKTALADKAD
jgi:hypothetical protein